MNPAPRSKGLHRFAVFVAFVAFAMISIGAVVTSRDAGLSIPDAVTNHGGVLPIEQIKNGYEAVDGRKYSGGDVFSEWFHRAVGWTLGSLAIALAFLVYKLEPRSAVRKLAFAALGIVVLQGAVGALGVWMRQPAAMVVPHAFLAQTFLVLVTAVAYYTSAEESAAAGSANRGRGRDPMTRGSLYLAILAFLQIIFGAFYRHAGMAWAIVSHVAAALVVAGVVAWLAMGMQFLSGAAARLGKHSIALGGIVMLQIFLGFLALFFRKPKNEAVERALVNILFPTLHVMCGALLTAGSALLAMRARTLLATTGSTAPARGSAERVSA